jgi:hypothetical protein
MLRDFWNSARRGTLGAIEFGARTVPGVESAQAFEEVTGFSIFDLTGVTGITRVQVTNQPARIVKLFIADSTGNANAALATIVRQALVEYRAGGIQVAVFTSSPQIVSVSLKLSFRGPVDTATLGEAVRQAVIAYVNSLPVNGPLYRAALFSVLQRYADDGLVVGTDSVVTPTGDVSPTSGFTIRVREVDVVLV